MNFGRVDRIAHIVPLPVRDKGDQALGLAKLPADEPDNIDIFHLVVAADVVHLTDAPLMNDQIDRLAVVLHIQPVAHVFTRAIDGQRLIRQSIDDHERDELFREVIGPVVVRASRDADGKPVGAVIRQNEQVGRRLGGRIRAGGVQRRLLCEEEIGSVQGEIAVDLVRGDLMISLNTVFAAGVHQGRRADDVGLQKHARILDRAIDVALRRKVDDDIGVFLLKELVHALPVADVQFDKAEIGIVHHIFERGQIARIGEFIQTDDAVVGILFEHMEDEIAADKPGAARNDDGHKCFLIQNY